MSIFNWDMWIVSAEFFKFTILLLFEIPLVEFSSQIWCRCSSPFKYLWTRELFWWTFRPASLRCICRVDPTVISTTNQIVNACIWHLCIECHYSIITLVTAIRLFLANPVYTVLMRQSFPIEPVQVVNLERPVSCWNTTFLLVPIYYWKCWVRLGVFRSWSSLFIFCGWVGHLFWKMCSDGCLANLYPCS